MRNAQQPMTRRRGSRTTVGESSLHLSSDELLEGAGMLAHRASSSSQTAAPASDARMTSLRRAPTFTSRLPKVANGSSISTTTPSAPRSSKRSPRASRFELCR